MNAPHLRVAVIGAGWAGLAAAVHAVQRGFRVTLLEAARAAGGRARSLPLALPGGGALLADNGAHIMIGAYTSTLGLMRSIGVDPEQTLQRLPLTLRYPDGSGLALPRLPRPLDALAGILSARGWRWSDRLGLLRAAARWRRAGSARDAARTVADLCAALPARAARDFIEPLCVAALNTPAREASADVFLRVLQDALLGPPGSADLLLPLAPLGALLPDPALRWLRARDADVRLGQRVSALHWQRPHWRIGDQLFDHVALALPAPAAARLLEASAAAAPPPLAAALLGWRAAAAALRHEAIATIYALADRCHNAVPWPAPLLALRADGGPQTPAQFVLDRGAPDALPNQRLLALVASAARLDNAALQQAALQQAQTQLGLTLRPLRTVTEKRATFACTPGLRRPPMHIAPGLLACGDYIDGPYPATLEGAVRSGLQAAGALR